MPISFHDAPEQREFGVVIPDGTFVKLKLNYKPGGFDWGGGGPQQLQEDKGLFQKKQGWTEGDAVNLECEFTIVGGKHDRQKVWRFLTVDGGNLDNNGQSKGWIVTKTFIRAAINSAAGIDPKDESADARGMREIDYFKQLENIEFWARLGVEEGGDRPGGGTYDDKNVIALVIEPNQSEYQDLYAGKEVEPQPSGTRRRSGGGGGAVNGSGLASAPAQTLKPWQRGSHPSPQATPQQGLPPAETVDVGPRTTGPKWMRR